MTRFRTQVSRTKAFLLVVGSATLIAPLPRALGQQVANGALPSAAARADELLARRVSVSLTHVPRSRAIDAIARSAKAVVQYRAQVLDAYPGDVSVRFTDVTLREALERVLAGTPLRVVVDPTGQIGVVGPAAAVVQGSGTVTGRVTDSATGKPMRGASVKVQGMKGGIVTNADGRFVLRDVPEGERALAIRMFGYRPAERSLTVRAGDTAAVAVVLASVPTTLTDVVTTATGQRQRLEVGNDITVLNVDSVMRTAPITSVTDLLEARVPGLVVLRSSGQPGAPSRIRLRGATSITRSNDPVLIVDGVRVYAEQASARSVNTAPRKAFDAAHTQYALDYSTQSPLDQIDPNSIETIEVLKGPSASATYGSDAGNGVIVITTKKGKAGPTRWALDYGRGLSFQPGEYPTGYYRFGHYRNAASHFCYRMDVLCSLDSVVAFQALNDPRFAVTGAHGLDESLSGTVAGGAGGVTYSLVGTLARHTGQLELPAIEAERFAKFHGGQQPPDWMHRPDRYTTAGLTTGLTLPLGSSGGRQGTVQLTNQLFRSDRQTSSLQSAVAQLMGAYVDTSLLDRVPLIPDFYDRATSGDLHVTTGATLNWPLLAWLPVTVTGGVDITNATTQTLTPRGFVDSLGSYGANRGTTLLNTLSARTAIPARWATTVIGFDVRNQSSNDIGGRVTGLLPGVTTPSSFVPAVPGGTGSSAQRSAAEATYGWYVEPQLNWHSRFFVTPALRLDGGSSSGRRVATSAGGLRIPGVSGFPKLPFSWVVIGPGESEGHRSRSLLRAVTTLQLRGAFGTAGVQPEVGQHLRLFGDTVRAYDGAEHPVVEFGSLGNTELRPERVQELEGGFHLELWRNRVSTDVTQYRHVRNDAIVPMPIAASVMENATVSTNIGQVVETGNDVQLTASLLERATLGWTVGVTVSHQANRVTRLAPGQDRIEQVLGNGVVSRVVAGYPLYGKWVRPVLGYVDVNQDGVIVPNEVMVGDSLAYVGQQLPNYEARIQSDIRVGRFSVHTTVSYENGLTQFNQAATSRLCVVRSFDGSCDGRSDAIAGMLFFGNDPNASLAQQAAFAAYLGGNFYNPDATSFNTPYGLIQTVSTLRWQTLSVNYDAPQQLARLFRGRHLTLMFQGSNLGLHTNYRGKDPNVNAFTTGENVMDAGQLPMPRTFSLRARLGN